MSPPSPSHPAITGSRGRALPQLVVHSRRKVLWKRRRKGFTFFRFPPAGLRYKKARAMAGWSVPPFPLRPAIGPGRYGWPVSLNHSNPNIFVKRLLAPRQCKKIEKSTFFLDLHADTRIMELMIERTHPRRYHESQGINQAGGKSGLETGQNSWKPPYFHSP